VKTLARSLLVIALTSAAYVVVAGYGGWPGGLRLMITHGTSMEPDIRPGDAALVIVEPSYRPGEVVAYRNATLRTTVLHRIRSQTSAGFTIRGDNTTAADPGHAQRSEIIGRLLLRLPGVGRAIAYWTRPLPIAALAAALVLLSPARHRGRHRRPPLGRASRAALGG